MERNSPLCVRSFPQRKILFFAANYSAGWIASVGHASAQVPQSVHISGLMLYLSPSEIAPTGHSSIQVPHAIQSSLIT